MKPRRIDLRNARNLSDVVERVLRTRHEEVLALAPALETREVQSLHHFRIACKRLRYALERFESRYPELTPLAKKLAAMQDALGEAHDRDVLLMILPPTIPETERRLTLERADYVTQATEIWNSITATPLPPPSPSSPP